MSDVRQVNFRASSDLFDTLDRLAHENRTSQSDFLRSLIRRADEESRNGFPANPPEWVIASAVTIRWSDESVCFDCPCGEKDIILSESGATKECECGRVYRLFCRLEIDENSVPGVNDE